MKVKIIMMLSILLISKCAHAQTPTIQWQKTLGGSNEEKANCVVQTSDGGFIVAGYTYSNDGDITLNKGGMDYWIVKLNATGNMQWQKTFGGSGDDEATSIVQTSDGGFAIAGYTISDDNDVIGNHGAYDYWILKLNSNGIIQWQKTLGGTDSDLPYGIEQTNDGGLVICGYTSSYDGDITQNQGGGDCWIVKLNSLGVIQWQKSLGGTSYDLANNIKKTSEGGLIFAGKTFSNDVDVSGNHGNYDYWVVKLNATGNIQWQKTLGGSNEDEANSVVQTADGGYLVSGIIFSSDGNITGYQGDFDYWVVKLNASGVIQWQNSLGGTSYDRAYSIVNTDDGGCVVAGSSSSYNGDLDLSNDINGNIWIVKLNNLGAIVWKKNIGGTGFDVANFISKQSNGGYIVGGFSDSNDGAITGNHGSYDYCVVSLNPENLSAASFSKNEIKLFPNPVNEVLNVISDNKITSLTINNLLGQEVFSESSDDVAKYLNVSNLPSGTYFVKITFNEKVEVFKIIKN